MIGTDPANTPVRSFDLYYNRTDLDAAIASVDDRGEPNSLPGHGEELTASRTASAEAASADEHEGPSV